jgi:hypothetical protein
VPKAGLCTIDAEAKSVHEIRVTVKFKIRCGPTGDRHREVNKTAARRKEGLIDS